MKEIGQNLFEHFVLDYFDKDWSDVLQFDQQDVNLSVASFFRQYELSIR